MWRIEIKSKDKTEYYSDTEGIIYEDWDFNNAVDMYYAVLRNYNYTKIELKEFKK